MKTKQRFKYLQNPITKLYTKVDTQKGRILKTGIKKPNVTPLESEIQCQVIEWFKLQYPQHEGLFWANPNGGSRHPLEAANLKRQGVMSGVYDLTLAIPRGPYHGAYFEVKRKGGKLSENQKLFKGRLTAEHYYVAEFYSFEEGVEVINRYLSLGEFVWIPSSHIVCTTTFR
jgi:hypothetical protein